MKKIIIISSIIVLLSIGSWVFIDWANSPIKQSVRVGNDSSPSINDGTQDIATNFFTTKLPNEFRIQVAENPSNSNMIQLTAFEKQRGQIQIGITTGLLPSDSLNGVADYLFRVKRNDLYTSIATTDFPSDSYTFKKISNDEITTFITHLNRYASIAISGEPVQSDEMVKIRSLIAENWRWL